MKEIHIDCRSLDNPKQLHELLRRELSFPDWYRPNLDALHDCLTGICEDTHLFISNFSTLPPIFRGFYLVLQDVEDENPHFYVTFQ